MGREHYNAVLAEPSKMPKDCLSLERLLSAASMAWERVTGDDDFPIECTEKSYESVSNLIGWGYLPNKIHSFCFENTKESIESMLAADRRESATLGRGKAASLLAKLDDLDFHSKYQTIAVRLVNSMEPGAIALHSQFEGETNTISLNGGFDAARFVKLSEVERDLFFIDLAVSALQFLSAGDQENLEKILLAKQFAINLVDNGSEQLSDRL